MEVKVISNIMKANEQLAAINRTLFNKHGVYVLNLLSSPGAGKTTLLETLIDSLKEEFSLAVIEGDIATAADSERIAAHGVPAVQINTGGNCHLDAGMIATALNGLPLNELDLLVIENVGNLVCPAGFNLGEHDKIMILSVSEGDDKPLKYPAMFRNSSALIINKIDLLSLSNFNMKKAITDSQSIQPALEIFPLSALKKENLEPLLQWLRSKIKDIKTRSKD